MSFIEELQFDDSGLIPAIVQDDETGQVLMAAYMNRESVLKTVESGRTCFWSRSRKKFWIKGESSGHYQTVRSLSIDCDGDCLLVRVTQEGAACHAGYRTCFYRQATPEGTLEITEEKVFDPKAVYK
ncbi:MAG: phosphoribosyl-AMP cyclohydrolase [Armatimonadetes bacterium]|nr:phosphoribosyl-AMP cyclohydrolase [Armatimonadota bacterium]